MTCLDKEKVIALTRDWCNLQEDYYCDGYTAWYICFVAVFVGSLWAVAVVSHARAFAVLFCQPTTLSFKSVSRFVLQICSSQPTTLGLRRGRRATARRWRALRSRWVSSSFTYAHDRGR